MSEVRIRQHTSMERTLMYCEAKIVDGTCDNLVLVAEGKAVNKCISITEILKRKHEFVKTEIHLQESPTTESEPMLRIVISKERGK